MAVIKSFPSQFYGETNASTTSTADAAWGFGFQATKIVVQNDKAAAVYVNFSTTPSTGGIRTCSGESLTMDRALCSGVAIKSQSTTTGTIARVWAIG